MFVTHSSLKASAITRLSTLTLDAFWSRLDAVQLSDAVATIKSMHAADGTRFAPGIYWTPFAYWSDDLDAYVEGTGIDVYRYAVTFSSKAPDRLHTLRRLTVAWRSIHRIPERRRALLTLRNSFSD